MKITYVGEGKVVVEIEGVAHDVDNLYGVPAHGSENFERCIRMNVHFWMGRHSFDDVIPGGDLKSSTCPYEDKWESES